MWRRAILLTGFAAGVALAADPDYFPLQAGNRWEYVVDGSAERRVGEVLGSDRFEGKLWFRVRWLSQKEYWLRFEGNRLLEWDRAEKTEVVWADFDGAATERVQVCVGGRVVAPPDVPLIVCGGLPHAAYLSGVGMVERTQEAFLQPVRMRLVAARIGGVDRTF